MSTFKFDKFMQMVKEIPFSVMTEHSLHLGFNHDEFENS